MRDTYNTETLTYRGLTFRVNHCYDYDSGPPWAEGDGHGPVSEWTTRKKGPGERVLIEDRESYRYYDFAEAVRIAKRDQWGSQGDEGLSAGEKAVRAVEADFRYLRGWCNNAWHYCGVVVTLQGTDISRSLWGIESSEHSYLDEVARELADAVIDEAPDQLETEIQRLQALAVRIVTEGAVP